MTNLKAPHLKRQHLDALRKLLRIDLSRAITSILASAEKADPRPAVADTAALVLQLTDQLTAVDQPLSVAGAMLDMQGGVSLHMPLSEDLYAYYQKMLKIDLSDARFLGLTEETLSARLDPLRALRAETQKLFDDAGFLTREEMNRPQGNGISGSTTKGVLN